MQDQLPVAPENPGDHHSMFAYVEALYPGKVTLPDDASDERRRDHNRKVRVYRLNAVARRHAERAGGARLLEFPKRRTAAARQRERRSRSGRSSARSGDSGSDDPGESDPAADWHWKQPDSWAGLIASVRSRDFERELHLERWTGVRA